MVNTPKAEPGYKNTLTENSVLTRLIFLILLVFLELLSVSLTFDANLPQFSESGMWYNFLAYTGNLAEIIVVFSGALALPIWVNRKKHLELLNTALTGYKFHFYLLLQLITFTGFFLLSGLVFGDAFTQADFPENLIFVWIVFALALALLSMLSIAPLHFWQYFLKTEIISIGFAILVGITGWGLAEFSQSLWNPLSDITFSASALLLDMFYPEIFIDVEQKLLGTYDFIVNIAPECSGYEGMGLVIIFTSAYLFIFRKEFRFPQALLLFPIGLLTIWSFNIIRIVMLISIGSSFSEQVAVGGFHSQAGWISFLLVIFGLLAAAHKFPFFSLKPPDSSTIPAISEISLATALLIPFVVLMTSIIISATFSGEFIWLYPLRVITVAIALFICWRAYGFSRLPAKLEPIIAGSLVYVIWLFLVPGDPDQNFIFADALFSVPLGISIGWLIFRFLGAVVTIPLAEELLFRGYLISRLTKQSITLEGSLIFSWVGLLASSVLFGLLHSHFIAGTIAGLVYGLVRYRGHSVLDAVIAHAVTNLLISITVIATFNWSLW